MSQPTFRAPANWRVIAAFAAVYIIWGSTYLAIRFAIETMPPFLMAGVRFTLAGALLYGWSRWRGVAAPKRVHWRSTLIIGGLLLMAGNGGVTWAEQHIPSSLASLLVAIVPLWVVLLDWVRPGGSRPNGLVLTGVLMGLAGMFLLVGPSGESGEALNPLGVISILIATSCWAIGSLYSRNAQLPDAPLLTTGMEMLCGGALLLLVGTVSGEWPRVNVSAISLQSLLALVYLIVFGAMIAYTAYVYLLKHTTAARASTYAYVNPVVAVFLGWAFANEALTERTLIAAAIIIASVFVINTFRATAAPAPLEPDAATDGEPTEAAYSQP